MALLLFDLSYDQAAQCSLSRPQRYDDITFVFQSSPFRQRCCPLGLLDGIWQQYIVNPPWNYHQKDTFMLQGIVGHNTRLISAVLPKEVLAATKGLGHPPGLPAPTPEWLARVKECTTLIAKRHETMEKARYTDKIEFSTLPKKDVLGGNIGSKRESS